MTSTPYGDPCEWDEIPPEFSTALEAALQAHGWRVTDAHESAITVDVPGLDEDEEWCLVQPNFHGWWFYGVYTNGVCNNPEFLYADAADAADPQAVADAADAVLRARRTT